MKTRIAIIISALGPGGAERVMAHLAGLVAKYGAENGIGVDLVVPSPQDETFKNGLSPEVQLVELTGGHYLQALVPLKAAIKKRSLMQLPYAFFIFFARMFRAISSLRTYLNTAKPKIVFTAHYNAITVFANWLSVSRSRVIITEHTVLSEHLKHQEWIVRRVFFVMCRLFYPGANRVIAVSADVAKDLVKSGFVAKNKVSYIYNPIVGPGLKEKITQSCFHPWLMSHDYPVFVAVARLSPEKDFETLLLAFAILCQKTHARLLILGDGPKRSVLEELARKLKICEVIDWLGHVENPLPFIREADVFVMSSLYEGLPTVVIEALAAGTTIVATDCPGGLREILKDGVSGYVVPGKNPVALAEGMYEGLCCPKDPKELCESAERFSEERAVRAYLSLIINNSSCGGVD